MYKIVQNEYKIMIQFFIFKVHLRRLHVSDTPPPLKFELQIAEQEKVYKNWDFGNKTVQNKYKIMMYFSLSKSVLGGW